MTESEDCKIQEVEEEKKGDDKRETETTPAGEMLSEFICPITHEVMRDPVVTIDGNSYERHAILKWFQRGKLTSPVSGVSLKSDTILPNLTLKRAIEEIMLTKRHAEGLKTQNEMLESLLAQRLKDIQRLASEKERMMPKSEYDRLFALLDRARKRNGLLKAEMEELREERKVSTPEKPHSPLSNTAVTVDSRSRCYKKERLDPVERLMKTRRNAIERTIREYESELQNADDEFHALEIEKSQNKKSLVDVHDKCAKLADEGNNFRALVAGSAARMANCEKCMESLAARFKRAALDFGVSDSEIQEKLDSVRQDPSKAGAKSSVLIKFAGACVELQEVRKDCECAEKNAVRSEEAAGLAKKNASNLRRKISQIDAAQKSLHEKIRFVKRAITRETASLCELKRSMEEAYRAIEWMQSMTANTYTATEENVPSTIMFYRQSMFGTASRLKNAKLTCATFLRNGRKYLHELVRDGFTVRDMRNDGIDAEDLRCEGFSVDILKSGGYGARECLDGGYSLRELKEIGEWSVAELRSEEIPPLDLLQEYELRALKRGGYSARECFESARCTLKELLEEGEWTAAELRKEGFSDGQLGLAGVIGYTALERKASGEWPASRLKSSGYTVRQCITAGYFHSASKAKEAGFTVADWRDAGYSAKECRDAGFSARDLYSLCKETARFDYPGLEAVMLEENAFGVVTRKTSHPNHHQIDHGNWRRQSKYNDRILEFREKK